MQNTAFNYNSIGTANAMQTLHVNPEQVKTFSVQTLSP